MGKHFVFFVFLNMFECYYFCFLRITPVAPPLPEQWQTAKENIHHPSQVHERSISASSTTTDDDNRRPSTVENLQNIISSIQQHSTNIDSRTHSRRSSSSSSLQQISEIDRTQPTSVQQGLIYATIQPPPPQQQHSRHSSYTDSVRSTSTASISKRSPVPSIQPKQDERASYRTASIASSSDRFPPPPPPNIETLDLYTNDTPKQHRSTPSVSSRSSAYVDVNEVHFPKKQIPT